MPGTAQILLRRKKCVLRPNRTFMKCSVPVTTNIPMTTASGTTFNLANLNIDTSKFHKPCIKFEFTSNILTAAGSLTFNFQINKQCKYQPTSFPIGPVWTFSRLASSVGEMIRLTSRYVTAISAMMSAATSA